MPDQRVERPDAGDSRRLRVVLLTPYPVDERFTHGGVQKVAQCLVFGLKLRDDIELHVVSLADIRAERTVAVGNTTIHYLPLQRRFRLPTFSALSVWRARRAIRRLGPDLVHCQEAGLEGYIAAPLPYPCVSTVHAVFRNEAKHYPGLIARLRYRQYAYYARVALPRIARFIPSSNYVLNEMPQLAGRTHAVIENPIEDRWFAVPDREVEGRVLFCGTMYQRKGVVDLVRAVQRVRESGRPVSLHVTGAVRSPEYFAEVKAAVRDGGLEDAVTFLGLVSEDDLEREFSEAAVVALPSYAETSPMFIGQAMAAGKAIVATRVGGLPWLVEEGVSGRLVEPGDVTAMASALEEILGNTDRRRGMARIAKVKARARFGVKEVAAQTMEVYRQVLAERERR